MTNITWQNETLELSKLKPARYNPRKFSKKQFTDISKSIEKFNVADPIVVNHDHTVIGGHLRLKVLKDKGIKEVAVRIPDRQLNEAEEKELNLRLNKNLGDWDFDLLGGGEFGKAMLTDSGFGTDELEKIFDVEVTEDQFNAQKEYDRINKPKAQPGQVYQLGPHRLMCGDSQDPANWEKLMAGKKAQLIFTDPPYNVGYDYSGPRGTRQAGIKSKKVFSDKKSPEELTKFLTKVISNLFSVTDDSAPFYIWYANSKHREFQNSIEATGGIVSQILIWLKDKITLAVGQDYHYLYEPCFFGWKRGKKHYVNKKVGNKWGNAQALGFDDFNSYFDVLFSKRDKLSDYIHPTQKPLNLCTRPLKRHSETGFLVVDAFAGSGSTMMACHQLGRICHSMELDPKFVDVILKRFEQTTNIKPILLP